MDSDSSSTASSITTSSDVTSGLSQEVASTSSADVSSTASADDSSLSSGEITSGRGHGERSPFVDLFAVQLEVTAHLLQAEKRKLVVLQKELLSTDDAGYGSYGSSTLKYGSRPFNIEQLQLNIDRIQQQCSQLEGEYEGQVVGLVRQSNRLNKTSRSQPATGLKPGQKTRPSIFGTVTNERPPVINLTEEQRMKSGVPQMSTLAHPIHLQPHHSLGNGPIDTNTLLANHTYGYTRMLENTSALVYQDGSLQSGSLEALIKHLVPTENYYPDRTYIFAFLLSSRLYIPTYELLDNVCKLCIKQQHLLDKDKISRGKLGKFGPHLIQFFSEWTELFPYDFRDDRLMKQLKDMTAMIVHICPELRREVGLIMLNLTSKLAGLLKYEDLLLRINQEVAQRLRHVMPTTDIYEVCPTPLVLAQQLTHLELERLSMIGAEEFVQAFVKDNDKDKAKSSDFKKTGNLEAYVSWFNRLSYFVATEICMHLKKKNRVRMIEYFVDVAKECVNIGNFNSLMAIIAGMNMSPISRLKKTWGKINKDKLDILEHQMNPSSNFSSYRSSLKAALWRAQSAMEERERIVIPFFTVFVKDIFFLNQGCASKTSNGQLNFDKFWQLAKQITDFITWKQVECPFDKHPTVLNYLLTNPVFSENSLSLASFECEPPENNYEKERYKSLKDQIDKIHKTSSSSRPTT